MILAKTQSGLYVPAYDDDYGESRRLSTGDLVLVTLKNQRAVKFHRKFFAMLDIGFDAWSDMDRGDVIYRGKPVKPEKERFRKDVTILAGFCRPVWNIRNEMRMEAESISFGNMSQERFEKVYNSVANVLLQKVLKNYTRDDLDRIVEQLVRF